MYMPLQLTADTLAEGVADLARRDPHLAAVVARHGAPPLWDRPPGFETLAQIILEQQISLSAGRAAHGRVERIGGDAAPERRAELAQSGLRSAGPSRQKGSYIRRLAVAIGGGAVAPGGVI